MDQSGVNQQGSESEREKKETKRDRGRRGREGEGEGGEGEKERVFSSCLRLSELFLSLIRVGGKKREGETSPDHRRPSEDSRRAVMLP